MLNIAALFCLAASIFFFIVYIITGIKNRGKIKQKIKRKQFKELNNKSKRIVVALILFFISAILFLNIVFALIISILYIYFNWYIKDKQIKKNAALIDKQVIEALTVIKNAVQSGKSLQNALETAGDELKEPIKSEFIKMSDRLTLGTSFEKVLNDAGEKAPSKEFKLMIDTIKISKDSGASLTGIFDRIIEATTQRIAIQSKVNALTAQGRMSGNVVSVIPFVVIFIMYVIEPGMMMSLFNTLAGNIMLLIVVAMVLTGSFVIRKLTEIDF